MLPLVFSEIASLSLPEAGCNRQKCLFDSSVAELERSSVQRCILADLRTTLDSEHLGELFLLRSFYKSSETSDGLTIVICMVFQALCLVNVHCLWKPFCSRLVQEYFFYQWSEFSLVAASTSLWLSIHRLTMLVPPLINMEHTSARNVSVFFIWYSVFTGFYTRPCTGPNINKVKYFNIQFQTRLSRVRVERRKFDIRERVELGNRLALRVEWQKPSNCNHLP